MKKEKDEDLDNLFRKGLEDPVNDAAFRDADWDAMEQMLDKRKKRAGIIYWLPVIGSAAALLLIFLGWLLFRPEVVKNPKQSQMTAAHLSNPDSSHQNIKANTNTGTSGGTTRQAADSKQKILTPANYAKNPGNPWHGQKSKSFFPLSAGGGHRDTGGIIPKDIDNKQQPGVALAANKTVEKAAVQNQSQANEQNMALNTASTNNLATVDTSVNKQQDKGMASNEPKKLVKAAIKQHLVNRPQFALSVLASPNLNGVNSSFQQSKVGGNFGLLFSVGFSKKWSVSTGAAYSINPYLTNFDNYHTAYQFKTQPSSVNANCRMLDIPLNVNYQVYSKQRNKISVGTGLSSYFMLREDYKFNYADTYSNGPTNFTVVNKNRNILSILNLNATYEHQVNSKVGITFQPYLKLPLSDVGASQVRLQTSGVAVGLNWNLNTSLKPK
ncbi:MAG: hypothetical protein JWP37_698 [Mucilaginibacter sp.]|nr:hypothetical protein [Mucilaginibacter sp.]